MSYKIIYTFIDNKGLPYYIGQTKDFKRRYRTHKGLIRNNNPLPKYRKARKLIRGGHEFIMAVLEKNIQEEEQANKREKYYIRFYKKQGIKLYNLTAGGEGVKERGIIAMRKKKMGVKRKPHSKKTKKKMSEIRMGIIFTEEHKRKLSIARRKRVTTEETKRKMSKSAKGMINIKLFVMTSKTGKEYVTKEGLTKFCEQHGLQSQNMYHVLNGRRKHQKGWTIRRSDE